MLLCVLQLKLELYSSCFTRHSTSDVLDSQNFYVTQRKEVIIAVDTDHKDKISFYYIFCFDSVSRSILMIFAPPPHISLVFWG